MNAAASIKQGVNPTIIHTIRIQKRIVSNQERSRRINSKRERCNK